MAKKKPERRPDEGMPGERRGQAGLWREVWRYVLRVEPPGTQLFLPAGSVFLAFGIEQGRPSVWFEVDPKLSTEERWFHLVRSGERFNAQAMVYRGSLADSVEQGTVHLYEAISPAGIAPLPVETEDP
jgi:hypothetical protein